jgi:hypothetical protein
MFKILCLFLFVFKIIALFLFVYLLLITRFNSLIINKFYYKLIFKIFINQIERVKSYQRVINFSLNCLRSDTIY